MTTRIPNQAAPVRENRYLNRLLVAAATYTDVTGQKLQSGVLVDRQGAYILHLDGTPLRFFFYGYEMVLVDLRRDGARFQGTQGGFFLVSLGRVVRENA